MINGFKFKPLNNLSLNIAVQDFDADILLLVSHMGKLMDNANLICFVDD